MTMVALPALLDHDRYISSSAFEEERRKIFGRCWIFIGLAAEFGAEEQIADIAGTPVSVLREGDGWRGRLSEGGSPVRIDRCGGLLFCCLSAETESLADYLGPYGAPLRELSLPIERRDHRERAAVKANWKTLIENTLDDYHVATIHPESFEKPMALGWSKNVTYERAGLHSLMSWNLNEATVANWEKLDRRLKLHRYSAYTGYQQFFIFPAFYISTAYASMAVLHNIEPQGVGNAVLDWSICLPLAGGSTSVREATKRAVIPGFATDARRIVGEDVGIGELAQQGRHFAVHPGLLGRREARVRYFQEAVRLVMGVPREL